MANKKFVPVVAVLNMKGGVGKTTLSANLFRRLYLEKEKKCLLLDLDPQFNLTQSLFKKQKYEQLRKNGQTIASVFGASTKASLTEISAKHQNVPQLDQVANELRYLKSNPEISISVVPGDFGLVKYSLMDDKKILDNSKKRFLKFVENSKHENDLVVLDCNPSSSYLTICALTACTHILVPVKLDRYSIIGLEMLWEFVNDILPIHPKPHFVIVINGVRTKPTKAMKETEAELRGHSIFGGKTLGNTIRETGQLAARSDFTGFSGDRKTSVTTRVQKELDRVMAEVSQKIGFK